MIQCNELAGVVVREEVEDCFIFISNKKTDVNEVEKFFL